MKSYAKIVDHTKLVRDMTSQAILNVDLAVVRKHEKRVMDLQKEADRTEEINSIKGELGAIRDMLRELLTKK